MHALCQKPPYTYNVAPMQTILGMGQLRLHVVTQNRKPLRALCLALHTVVLMPDVTPKKPGHRHGSKVSPPPGITMGQWRMSNEENDLPVDRGICAFMSTLRRE